MVTSLMLRPTRNVPSSYDLVSAQAPDITPYATGSAATITAALALVGVSAGAAAKYIRQAGDSRGIVIGIRSASVDATPGTPSPSTIAGVGSST